MNRRRSARIAAAAGPTEKKVRRLDPEVDAPTSSTRPARTRLRSKQPLGNSYEPEPGKEDWRLNEVVIEIICRLLPVEDIKSVRLVCKTWAVAGSVPLNQKTVISTNLCTAQKCLDFVRSLTFATGFRLRNVDLSWSIELFRPWWSFLDIGRLVLKSPELQASILQSTEFRTLSSLKLRGCHFHMIAKSILPFYLPTHWKNLKSLELESYNKQRKNTCDVFQEPPNGYPELNLEFLGIQVNTTYNWDFLNKCVKLKALQLHAIDFRNEEDGGVVDKEVKIQKASLTYDEILAALKGKKLESLDLRYNTFPVVSDRTLWRTDDVIEYPEMIPMWAGFVKRLIVSTAATLRHLTLSTDLHRHSLWTTTPIFQDLPAAGDLSELRSLSVELKGTTLLHMVPGRWTSSVSEIPAVLHAKGYLEVENFELSYKVREPGRENYKEAFNLKTDRKTSRFFLSSYGREKYWLQQVRKALLPKEVEEAMRTLNLKQSEFPAV